MNRPINESDERLMRKRAYEAMRKRKLRAAMSEEQKALECVKRKQRYADRKARGLKDRRASKQKNSEDIIKRFAEQINLRYINAEMKDDEKNKAISECVEKADEVIHQITKKAKAEHGELNKAEPQEYFAIAKKKLEAKTLEYIRNYEKQSPSERIRVLNERFDSKYLKTAKYETAREVMKHALEEIECLHIEISDLKKLFEDTIVKAVTSTIKSHRSKLPENRKEIEIDADPLFIEESFREETLISIPETNDKTFNCSWCCKIYKTSLGLTIHQKDHSNAISNKLRCYECDQLFCNYNLLTAHFLQLHPVENESQDPVDEEFEKCLVELNFLETMMCHICFIECKNLAVFSSHVISDHSDQTDLMKWLTYPCSQCNDIFPSVNSLKTHWTLNCCKHWQIKKNNGTNNDDFICEQCGLKCANENVLSNHINTHQNDAEENSDRLQCERCERSFKNKGNLKNHIQNVHENKRIMGVCELCGKTMAKSAVKHHLRTVHSKEKPFKCKICSKGFSASSNLKWHYNTHTGDQPFKCSFCDKSYPSSAARTQHELAHKGGCECKVCGQKFKYYYERSLHRKEQHGDNSGGTSDNRSLACRTCGKMCVSYPARLQHEMYHHKGNECVCDECGQKCKNPAALKSHKRVHEDFLRFGCSLCDKKFRFAGNFYPHRKQHKNQTAIIIKLSEVTTKVSLGSNINNSEKEVVRDISSNSATNSQNNGERSLSFSSPPRLQGEMENDNMEPPDSPEDYYEPESDCVENTDPPVTVLDPQSGIVDKSRSNELAAIPTVSSLPSSFLAVTKEIACTPADITSTVSSSYLNFPKSNVPQSCHGWQAQEIAEENQSAVIVESKTQSHSKEGDLKVRQSIANENDPTSPDKGKLMGDSESAATVKTKTEAEDRELEYYESDDSIVFEIGDSCEEEKLNQCEPRNLYAKNISGKIFKSFPHDPFDSQLFVKLTKLKEYKCQPCNKSFFQQNELEIHERKRDHIRKRMLEKLNAGKKRTRRSSKKSKCESKKNRETKYTCKICDAKLTSAMKFKVHYRIEHPGIKSYQCEKCHEEFATQEYLERHNRRIHLGIKDKYTPRKPSIRKSQKGVIKIKKYICEKCGQAFERPSELELHKKRHAGIKDFKCEECGKSFDRAFVLKQHKKRHTGIRDFICEECGAAFFRNSELKDHIQSVHQKHNRKKEYKMKNKHKMKPRIRPKHYTERPFSCELCSAKFSKESLLKKHAELHDPSRPYACDLCGYRFKFQSNVHSHKMYLHKETENENVIADAVVTIIVPNS